MSDAFQNLTPKDWLSFSVLGTAITVVGSFIALFAKEFVAARSFERWKARQALATIYDRYRRPIATASEELSGRCYRYSKRYENWRERTGIEIISHPTSKEPQSALANERYYRYSLLSDAYRLCCFFGWLELYRRDMGLLNVNQTEQGRSLERVIKDIRSDLADGPLNYHSDWTVWRDSLVFREEQRAIAHRMIGSDAATSLIDFGTFCEAVEKEISSDDSQGWFIITVHFFSNLNSERDFRITRMKRLVVHLTALRELLQPGSVSEEYRTGNKQLERELVAEKEAATIRANNRSLA